MNRGERAITIAGFPVSDNQKAKGDPKKAIADYEKALGLNPKNEYAKSQVEKLKVGKS